MLENWEIRNDNVQSTPGYIKSANSKLEDSVSRGFGLAKRKAFQPFSHCTLQYSKS